MSAARFARSPWRLFLCGGVIILLLTMLVIFHNQQELDEKREKRLRSLNDQLQSILEQKYDLERNNENERIMQTNTRRNLEQKLNELKELQAKEQHRYEKLLQSQKSLQSKHNELTAENEKSRKQNQEYEKNLKDLRTQLEKEKSVDGNEMKLWKDKYDAMLKEKERLQALLTTSNTKYERVVELEHLLNEYKLNCNYQPGENSKIHMHKPLLPPDTVYNSSVTPLQNESLVKSFNKQELVSPGQYRIDVKTTNLTATKNITMQQSAAMNPTNMTQIGGSTVAQLPPIAVQRLNAGLILNSVENFQIVPKLSADKQHQLNQQPSVAVSPLSAPRKPTSTDANKISEKQVLGPGPVIVQKSTNSSSIGSSVSPLQLPVNQHRKLPENVAPIPAYFDEFIKNDIENQKSARKANISSVKKQKNDKAGAIGGAENDIGDNDTAAEVVLKNDNDDNNNRYSNIVNDLDDGHARKAKKDAVEDSGAHEIKDFGNGENFNLPAEDGNFFAGDNDGVAGGKVINVGPAAIADDNREDGGVGHHKEDDDDDILGAGGADTGDIAVKNRNQLLDAAENLNNEVAGDQGKEFPADELHLEDGNDEDGDEDDYSNLAARQQGAQAIRN